jgi:hypothetical protein
MRPGMEENRVNTLFCQGKITYFPFETSSPHPFSFPDLISGQDAVKHSQKRQSSTPTEQHPFPYPSHIQFRQANHRFLTPSFMTTSFPS